MFYTWTRLSGDPLRTELPSIAFSLKWMFSCLYDSKWSFLMIVENVDLDFWHLLLPLLQSYEWNLKTEI